MHEQNGLEVSIHYDEIGLKGKNRPFFETRLCRNAAAAAAECGRPRVRAFYGRLILAADDRAQWDRIKEILPRVFGIAHFGRVWRVPAGMDAVTAAALEALPRESGLSFGVKARRITKDHPFRSHDICRVVGAAVQADRAWRVDLSSPDVTLAVTVMGRHALLSWEKIPGPGGLPLGVSGKAVCLLSGGLDSPIAAYRLMRRGAPPVFVHFHSYPFTGRSSQESALRVARHLLGGQMPSPFWLVPLGEVQQEIIGESAAELRVLLYRRFMLHVAVRIARLEGAQALVTGECLGQVASQTMENMAALERGIPLPILRPLVGFDKKEIVAAGRRIGTYRLRDSGNSDCCSYLVPRHPATRVRPERLLEAEAALPAERLIEDALGRAERIAIGGAEAADPSVSP